jgi:ABC-2 type transport system ATP-binding protein
MIDLIELTKRYGSTTALDKLSFTIEPGQVTGFLGPNGAGKSTAMRVILGLDRPDSGTALINGKQYRQLRQPLHEIGALLDARSFHAGRSAHSHLLGMARTHAIARKRVDDVLEMTGLSDAAHKSPGTYSLGMAQRLGLAAALIGDPSILILDEPMNGLDAEGMSWMRSLLPQFAAEGRAIFVSSHLMSEMAQVADRLIVIARGRLVADTTVTDFVTRAGGLRVRVRTPNPGKLTTVLTSAGGSVVYDTGEVITVSGIALDDIGDLAAQYQIVIYELSEEHPSLETAFLQLLQNDSELSGRNA